MKGKLMVAGLIGVAAVGAAKLLHSDNGEIEDGASRTAGDATEKDTRKTAASEGPASGPSRPDAS